MIEASFPNAVACVIGYGSIGKRHREVLNELGVETISVSRSSADKASAIFSTLKDALSYRPSVNYLVVATETSHHVETLSAIVDQGLRIKTLVEKPVFDKVEKRQHYDFPVMVGYNLRFHPAIEWLKRELTGKRIFSGHFLVGQWLPEWRKNVDYRTSYSADIKSGGGVLNDLSHELDLVLHLVGHYESICGNIGQRSDLEISSDDCCDLMIRTDSCQQVLVSLNYLSRPGHRSIKIHADSGTYSANLVTGECNLNTDLVHTFVCDRNLTYREMHKDMLNGASRVATLSEGLEVVEWIEKARKSDAEKKWILKA
jgi:predicted dehydrogenase